MEIWKKHPVFDKYEISTFGRVRTWNLGRRFANETPPLILKPKLNRDGYIYITLWKDKGWHHRAIHRLVLETFYRKSHYDEEARHIDGDRENNRLSNLTWGTHRENELDKMKTGTFGKKLNAEQVRQIRIKLRTEKRRDVAKEFGVSISMIDDIKSGKKWAAVSA